jgi:hypothetical protein
MRGGILLRITAIALGVLACRDGAAAIHSRYPAPVVDPSVPAPVITFDQMFFDFGKIPAGQTVVHDFIVSNTGRAPLQLEKVDAVCGCTSTLVGKRSLNPGESTKIIAVYTPEKGFTGAMQKTILVVCNDPAHPKLTLRFGGKVIPPSPQSAP